MKLRVEVEEWCLVSHEAEARQNYFPDFDEIFGKEHGPDAEKAVDAVGLDDLRVEEFAGVDIACRNTAGAHDGGVELCVARAHVVNAEEADEEFVICRDAILGAIGDVAAPLGEAGFADEDAGMRRHIAPLQHPRAP